jgi:hypothetical protein
MKKVKIMNLILKNGQQKNGKILKVLKMENIQELKEIILEISEREFQLCLMIGNFILRLKRYMKLESIQSNQENILIGVLQKLLPLLL